METSWRAALQADIEFALAGVKGEFAVGLRLTSGRTVLAVDRFAICSLCYRQVDDQLLFAESADLLADATPEIDPQAIFDYLYFHVIPSPRTIYKGIYRLPPGHFAVFENGQLRVAPYWVPKFEEQASGADFDSLKQEFRSILQNAVSRELDHDHAGLFPERRHRQLHRGRHGGPGRWRSGEHLLDRFRRAGLRRDGVRAAGGQSLQDRAP